MGEGVKVTVSRSGVLAATVGKLKATIRPEGDEVCVLTISGRGSSMEVALLGGRLLSVAQRTAFDCWREALECADAPVGGIDSDGILRVTVETPKPSVTVLTVVGRDAPDDAVVVSVGVRSMRLTVKADCVAGLPALGIIGRALWDVGIATRRDPLGIPTAETVLRVLGSMAMEG